LSSNVDGNFTTRELKSIHVDAVGTYLKLVIHKNHVNRLNLFNQACQALLLLTRALDSEAPHLLLRSALSP
jgi:centrosomal protein CEP104